MIAYVSIGNSDDKLTQADWSGYLAAIDGSLRHHGKVHGYWLSPPNSPWQNACWCVEYDQLEAWPTQVKEQKRWLMRAANKFRQNSIAWAEVRATEFLGTPDDGISPKGSAHGGPDWRADPEEVTDPCTECDGAGCQHCNGTGNKPTPAVVEHRVELLYDRLMLSYTAHCSCGWRGQEEKSRRSAWGHSAGHEHDQ